MADDFLISLQTELQEIDQRIGELEGELEIKKEVRQTIFELIDVYLKNGNDNQRNNINQSSTRLNNSDDRKSRAKERTKKILNAVYHLLNNKERPTPTAKILEDLQALDIDVPGDNPRNNLSAMMSYDENLKAHGRLGWTYEGKELAKEDRGL